MILEISGLFNTEDIEAALDDLTDFIASREDEGRSREAYDIALLVMAEMVCDQNEPIIN